MHRCMTLLVTFHAIIWHVSTMRWSNMAIPAVCSTITIKLEGIQHFLSQKNMIYIKLPLFQMSFFERLYKPKQLFIQLKRSLPRRYHFVCFEISVIIMFMRNNGGQWKQSLKHSTTRSLLRGLDLVSNFSKHHF